jgi:hypothetical protein
MPSREKRLRIPAALAFVLLAPGTLSCSASSGCNAFCTPLSLDAGLPDAGSECTGPNDPRLTDPRWECLTPI